MHIFSASKLSAVLLFALLLANPSSSQEQPATVESEHNNSPGQSPGATKLEIGVAVQEAGRFASPASLAFNEDQATTAAKKAKATKENLVTARGNLDSQYDVVIQVGHYPRKTGVTGGQGSYISEQEAAAWVGEMLAKKLQDDGLDVLLIPADEFTTGIRTRSFIALHTDSTARKCAVGPSLGYGAAANKSGMDMLAVAVAVSLAISPRKFMEDNYTRNLSGYYAYGRVEASEYEGVLEMMELTCPEQELAFLRNAPVLANNLAIAIQLSLR